MYIQYVTLGCIFYNYEENIYVKCWSTSADLSLSLLRVLNCLNYSPNGLLWHVGSKSKFTFIHGCFRASFWKNLFSLTAILEMKLCGIYHVLSVWCVESYLKLNYLRLNWWKTSLLSFVSFFLFSAALSIKNHKKRLLEGNLNNHNKCGHSCKL